MAIVPLLVINTNVMIAISSRGTLVPKTVNPKTSLGYGQGTTVEARAVINEIKKQLNMNVSLKRKIHIIALPQGTPLKALWSRGLGDVYKRQLHGLHLIGGLIYWIMTIRKVWIPSDIVIAKTNHTVELCAIYWHFLLAVWVVLFGLMLFS